MSANASFEWPDPLPIAMETKFNFYRPGGAKNEGLLFLRRIIDHSNYIANLERAFRCLTQPECFLQEFSARVLELSKK